MWINNKTWWTQPKETKRRKQRWFRIQTKYSKNKKIKLVFDVLQWPKRSQKPTSETKIDKKLKLSSIITTHKVVEVDIKT